MMERSPTDDDGRMDPMVPEMPARRVRTDGGRKRDETATETSVLAETGAPLVPDLS